MNGTRAKDANAELLFGLRACEAVFEVRPHDVRQVLCSRETVADAERALRRAGCDVRPTTRSPKELDALARTNQHEGMVIEVRARTWTSIDKLCDKLLSSQGVAVALDRVRNPYNVGAILRSAAFFGVDGVLLGAAAPHPALDPNAVRVAEGGVERLVVSRTTDLVHSLSVMRQRGIVVIGAAGESDVNALCTSFERPTLLVMGHEREGLSPRVRAQCDQLVAIPGTGSVESLNVGVAAGILCACLTSRTPLARPPTTTRHRR